VENNLIDEESEIGGKLKNDMSKILEELQAQLVRSDTTLVTSGLQSTEFSNS
jgi:hypothetical protein